MKSFYKIIIATAIGCWSLGAQAQQELLLHSQPSLWQSTFTNPAHTPTDTTVRWTLALPSAVYQYNHSAGTALVDWLAKGTSGNPVLSLAKPLAQADPTDNTLNAAFTLHTFYIGYQQPRWWLQAGHSIRAWSQVRYTKDLLALAWRGNAAYIGQTANLSAGVEAILYHELSIGGGWRWENVQIGARLKWLSGVLNVSTPTEAASLTTDADVYQLTLAGNLQLNTAGWRPFQQATTVTDRFRPTADNQAMAVDIGMVLTPAEGWRISASLLDIGGTIHWRQDPRNYFKQDTLQYNGVTRGLADILQNGDIAFDGIADTLTQFLQLDSTANAYYAAIPTQFYGSLSYDVHPRWTVGATYHYQQLYTFAPHQVGVFSHWRWGRHWRVGLAYAYRHQRWDNLGVSLAWRWKALEVYALSDNVLGAFTPWQSANTQARVGINLIFNQRTKKQAAAGR